MPQAKCLSFGTGGPHCLWIGMNGGSIPGQCTRFRDFKAIGERSEIVMLDEQARAARP